jgi:site-specific DNA recombinase
LSSSSAARKLSDASTDRRSASIPAAKPIISAVLYARVSSKDQEKEGFSIPAQQKLLRSYAEEKGFNIIDEFIDIETAKKAGRTGFTKMLASLRKKTTCRVILVEKTDRLYRNLKDWVELDGMDLDIHLVKEGTILSDASRSSEKFIHGIKVLMAKNYIDNLSEEVKKGMLEKAEQGIWPGPAPLGYINVSRPDGKRIVDLDPEYSAAAKRLFELYATGQYTLKELAKDAKANGVVTRKAKKPLQIATIHLILHNPLYKGEFLWQGKWYQGSHPALVTPKLWERVQDLMAGRGSAGPHQQKHNFAFNGLVHCGVCAELGERRLLVGEIQKQKYIYYHCNACQRAGRKAKFIREEALGAYFVTELRRLHLDTDVLDWLKTALRSSHKDEQRFHHAAITRLTKQYAALQRKLDVLYEDRLEGRLSVERYEEKANGFREEMAHARAELARHEKADRSYTEEGIALLELAGMALELYESQDAGERRRMLDFLCLNSEFRGDSIVVQWRKPFDVLAESIEAKNEKGVAIDESSDAHQVWLPLVDLNHRPPD